MKVTIAMDSFKGSLTSMEAGEAVKRGILRVQPEAAITVRPLADGGEGTVNALIEGRGAKRITCTVAGPLGAPVRASYGYLPESRSAIIEMAAAAGLTLLDPSAHDPLSATSFGVGQLILDAIKRGAVRFVIGIGGSATNDGGTGMLRALGYRFLDEDGEALTGGASILSRIHTIEPPAVQEIPDGTEFQIACDVTNPLCGEDGATFVFGAQKGLAEDELLPVDIGMANFAKVACDLLKRDYAKQPGSGAAGGLGFAFCAFLGGTLTPGIELVLELIRLKDDARDADIVVTGEGRLDGQSAMGKAPVGVARLAKKYGAKVLAFAGSVSDEARVINAAGIDAFFPILRKVCTLSEAMEKESAAANLTDSVEQVFRLL